MSVDLLPYAADLIDYEIGFDACCTLRRARNRRPFCAQPAEWACRLGCCGNIKVVCDQHHNIPVAVYPKLFVCSYCRRSDPDIVESWRI